MIPVISCNNVSIGYDGREGAVISNISFDVFGGDYLCIVGENGSGKTTLMKSLLGLIKPMSGEILYNGVMQTEVGYVPQKSAANKDFPASVYEVVISGCKVSVLPFHTKKDKELANSNMALLGIDSIKKKPYHNLSGGQQQRVLLARALCATKSLLLLDEPVSGLDPKMSGEIYSLLRHLNRTHGITIIMISHDIKNSASYGNKILHLDRGQFFFGSMGEFQTGLNLKTEAQSKIIPYSETEGGKL